MPNRGYQGPGRGSRAAILWWLLATSAGLDGAAAGELQVTGGLAIAEVEGDVIGPARPLATSLATPIELRISIPDCSGEPLVECDWTLKQKPRADPSCREFHQPAAGGKESWRGCRGEILLEPPARTGSYDFELACTVEGKPQDPIASRLFVTYAEPLAAVSPPAVDWYDRATCWAGGFDAGHTEEEILREIVDGFHEFGRGRWRYGYARPEGAERFVFPLAEDKSGEVIDFAGQELKPTCNALDRCKCTWQGLVGSDSLCEFGDCYIFSDLLQSMAGVMGVGGLKPYVIQGKGQAGFLTVRRESIDPEFLGTGCEAHGDACFEFQFGNHSLRLRDMAYYDATFNQSYNRPDEPVALNKKPSSEESSALSYFEDTEFRLYRVPGRHYGTWTFYSRQPARLIGELKISFPEQKVVFERVDDDGDGIAERLTASFNVKILVPGTHLIYGGLNKGEHVVARQPRNRSSTQTVAVVDGKAGDIKKAELPFSGQEIFRSGLNGPYDFFAVEPGAGSQLTARTRRSRFKRFGELDAALPKKGRVRPARGSAGRFLKIVIRRFAVRKAGTFAIEARLSKGRTTIAYAGEKRWFPPGTHRVMLGIPGGTIVAGGHDGPWDLTVVLYDGRLSAIEYLEQTTRAWPASAFE